MFGIKKKDDEGELPDLNMPGLPSIRDYQRSTLPPIEHRQDEEQAEIHGLPSFPDSLMKKGFSQSMVKSAVEDNDKNLPELPEWNQEQIQSKPIRTMELNEWSPKPVSQIQNRPIIQETPSTQDISNQTNSKRPIFIKLDKFKEARDSLEKISEKLSQMDELLKVIKDLKSKEEQEVSGWERDIESIKSRIMFINKEIFENAY